MADDAARPGPGWPPCLKPLPGGVTQLDVSVSPNARRTEVQGWHDGALRVRLAAPPVDGKANACLVAWVAAELGCPRRSVRLLRGDTQRRKQLAVDLAPERLAAWVAERAGDAPERD
jgi:hypothetical protein